MSIYNPFPYQVNAVSNLTTIFNKYERDQRVFLKLPTGTGKTWTAFFFIKSYYKNKKVKIVWTAHQIDLVEQSQKALCGWLSIPYDPSTNVVKFDKITIEFTTWQGLAIRKSTHDLLIIDEVHCGGSQSYSTRAEKRDHSTFKTIMKLAPAHLYISATPYNLDPKVFPGLLQTGVNQRGETIQQIKSDRQTSYSRQQAYSDSAIVNVKFISVQTVDTLKLRDTLNEHSFEDLEEGAKLVKDNDINLKDVESIKALNVSLRESMLSVYFLKEVQTNHIPQTMIFCKTRGGTDTVLTAASICAEVRKFAIRYKKEFGLELPSGKSLVRVVTSESDDASQDFEDFKNCKFPILCIVGMAKEGFDAPKTEVVIDLAHNTKNLRDLEQKIGRPIRIHSGKGDARFYYPDTFDNYLTVKGRKVKLNEEARQKIKDIVQSDNPNSDISPEMQEAVEAAVLHTTLIQDTLEEGNPSTLHIDNSEIIERLKPNGEKQNIIVTSTSLVVKDASNSNPFKNLETSYLFDNTEEVEGQRLDLSTIKKLRAAMEAGLI